MPTEHFSEHFSLRSSYSKPTCDIINLCMLQSVIASLRRYILFTLLREYVGLLITNSASVCEPFSMDSGGQREIFGVSWKEAQLHFSIERQRPYARRVGGWKTKRKTCNWGKQLANKCMSVCLQVYFTAVCLCRIIWDFYWVVFVFELIRNDSICVVN